MRYSHTSRFAIQTCDTAEQFFAEITAATSAEDRRGGVLLVGGVGPHDLVVRQAQAELRLDHLPSYWSHAALILNWQNRVSLDQVIGAEVALDPTEPDKQVPERNGVTLFRLARYANPQHYPNLAFGTLCETKTEGLKDAIEQAVLYPNSDRLRYRLWEWLGVWKSYTFAPARTANPVATAVSLPAAALCEYAYEAAGIDLTPGATAPNACPELLWNTLLYWYDRLGQVSGNLKAWSFVQTDEAPTRLPLSISLEVEFQEASRAVRPPRARKRRQR